MVYYGNIHSITILKIRRSRWKPQPGYTPKVKDKIHRQGTAGPNQEAGEGVSLDFLRTHSLFGGLNDRALSRIRALLTPKRCPEGTEFVREGDFGGNLYLIWRGSAEVLKKNPESPGSPPCRISLLREGDSFGEMELIDIQPAAATVRAREETEVLVLTKGDLYRIEKEDLPTFTMIVMNLAREISRHLRARDTLAAHSLFRKPTGPGGDPSAR